MTLQSNGPKLKIKYQLKRGDFVSEIDIDLFTQGTCAIFGASGSGKTSLLRVIAGLDKIPGAYLSFKGDVWQSSNSFTQPQQRPLAYVFQEASLFEHLNIEKNLLYGWKRTKRAKTDYSPERIIELLDIQALLHRLPSQLSGGQQQRVAIGRALLSYPELLLMDEPLSNLDETSKLSILQLLNNIQNTLDIPILYVSHSIKEVVKIADRILLIDKGKNIAYGETNHVLTDPSLPLSTHDEASAVCEGTIISFDEKYQLYDVETAAGTLSIPCENTDNSGRVKIRIAARDLSLCREKPQKTSITNIFKVEIIGFKQDTQASQILVQLLAGDIKLLSRITLLSKEKLNLKIGDTVYAQVKGVSLL